MQIKLLNFIKIKITLALHASKKVSLRKWRICMKAFDISQSSIQIQRFLNTDSKARMTGFKTLDCHNQLSDHR